MEWRKLVVTALGAGLVTGCQLLVTFETVPEGSGGAGIGGGGAGGATTGGATTGGAGEGGATTTTGEGGAMCTSECCSTADCPAPADPCLAAACEAGQCALTPIPDGADASVQTPGDCKRLVCQGGKAAPVPDGADILDDGNDCTLDSCQGSEPASSPLGGMRCALPGGLPGICNGKARCVECLSNAHCPSGAPDCDNFGNDDGICVPLSCSNNTQDPGETALNCGGPTCAPCEKGKPCIQASDCVSGVCGANSLCVEPTCMDGVRNDNETDVDCGGGCPDCEPGQRCNANSDCTSGDCTGTGGVCVATCDDDLKNNTESDVDCGGGVCSPCQPGKTCGGVAASCLSGDCGPAGTCEPGDLGTPCFAGADCLSGNCRDGVCCDAQCTGLCKSCNLPGSVGVCTDIPAGQDPQNECLGSCNGNGGCTG